MRLASLLVGASALAAMGSTAYAANFNFEDLSYDDVTSYSSTDSGLTMSLSRADGSVFNAVDLSGLTNVPANFLTHSLSPFDAVNGGAFVANFDQAVSYFAISFGDFVPSDLDFISIQGYSGLNGTGTQVFGLAQYCCDAGSGFDPHTLSVAAPGIMSVVFSGGSAAFPQSVYWDNISTSPVPEPSTWAMLLAGFAGLGFAAYRARPKDMAAAAA